MPPSLHLAGAPTPPTSIASQFSAYVSIRSAAVDNTTFYSGPVVVDSALGAVRKIMTDYSLDPPAADDFLLRCDEGKEYYTPSDEGDCELLPSPRGECPVTEPGLPDIPPDALYLRSEQANGVDCDVWEFNGKAGSAKLTQNAFY